MKEFKKYYPAETETIRNDEAVSLSVLSFYISLYDVYS